MEKNMKLWSRILNINRCKIDGIDGLFKLIVKKN